VPEDLLQAENVSAVDQVAHAEGMLADVGLKFWYIGSQIRIAQPAAHSEEAFTVARKAGRALTLEQVVRMAQEFVTGLV